MVQYFKTGVNVRRCYGIQSRLRRQCLIYGLRVGNVGSPFPTNYL